MDSDGNSICGNSDNGEALYPRAVCRILPCVPDPGQPKNRRLIPDREAPRFSGGLVLLVVSTDRNKGEVPVQGCAPKRAVFKRLHACIERVAFQIRPFAVVADETPAHRHEFALVCVFVLPKNWLNSGRPDVVPRLIIKIAIGRFGAEVVGNLLFAGNPVVATAHASILAVLAAYNHLGHRGHMAKPKQPYQPRKMTSAEMFREAEASALAEGWDASNDPDWQDIKRRYLAGEISNDEAIEIIKREAQAYEAAISAGKASVVEKRS